MSACFNHQKNLKQLRKVLHSGVYVKKDLLNITLKKDENRKAFRSSQPLDRRLIKMSTEPNCSSIEGVFPSLCKIITMCQLAVGSTAFSWKSQLSPESHSWELITNVSHESKVQLSAHSWVKQSRKFSFHHITLLTDNHLHLLKSWALTL